LCRALADPARIGTPEGGAVADDETVVNTA
jgi:hypothetical protein